MPASWIAFSSVGTMHARWARLASSGTTPPYGACIDSWLATTLERTRSDAPSNSTTLAAVSSQLVSRPSTSIVQAYVQVAARTIGRAWGPGRERP
ncbi:MAG: hypothetical protein RLZZ217_1340 [Planctomycetota bacterium]